MALSADGPSKADIAEGLIPTLLEKGPDKVPAAYRRATIDAALAHMEDEITGFWWFWLNLAWIRVKGSGGTAGWQRACPGGVPRVNANGNDWSWQVEIAKLLTLFDALLVLKARQIGFTYLLANLVVWIAIHTKNGVGVAVMANKSQSAKRLMQRSLQTYNRLPQWLKDERPMLNPAISRMVFANGSIVEPYSGDPNAARSDDATWVIADEIGEFEYLDDWYAAVESIADDGGHLVMCGTAKNNGLENYVKDAADGEEVACALVAGKDGSAMRLPVTFGENNINFLFVPDRVHPNRTDEWRTQKLKSFKGNLRNFEREHPQTWQEAFIAQGGGYFDALALSLALDFARDRWEVRDVRGHLRAARDNPRDVKFFPDVYGHVVRHCSDEEFDTLLATRRSSVIGVDSAGDRADGDFHAASALMRGNVPTLAKDFDGSDPESRLVFDLAKGEWVPLIPHVQLFTIHGHFDSDQYAEQVCHLGYLLGGALLGIETNGVGHHVLKTVRRLRYPAIFRRKTSEKKKDSAVLEEYGWWTNAETKHAAYGELERCLRNGFTDIRDHATLLEMGSILTLGAHGNGIGAKAPKHDDRGDGLAIAHGIIERTRPFGAVSGATSEVAAPWGSAEWLEQQFVKQDRDRNPALIIGNENRHILSR